MVLNDVEVLTDDHGGYGVFLSDLVDFKGKHLEVMRLSQCYDIKRLLGCIDSKQFKTIINDSLGELSQLSETCMLVYFILVIHLMAMEGAEGIPNHITEYISSVLLTTEINNASNCIDALMEHYGHVVLFHELKHNLDTLHEAAVSHIPYQQHYSVGVLRQLYSAIVSRVLEIPQLSEASSADGSFVVTPSLVPTLDYVNHGDETTRNAYYDIDRTNGDIVLRLDPTKIRKKGLRREVLISYTDIEDSMGLITKYGFDPANDTESQAIKLFSCPLDKKLLSSIDSQGINIRNFYKWFCVLPTIQFVRQTTGEWCINNTISEFARLLLPFVIDPQTGESYWQYSDGEATEQRFMKYIKETYENEDITYSMVKDQYQWYEASSNDYIPLPPCVWYIKSKFTEETCDVMEQEDYVMNLLQTNSSIFEATLENFESYLKKYIDNRIKILQAIDSQNNTALSQIVNREMMSLSNTLTQLQSGKSIYLNSDDPRYQTLPVIPTRNIEDPPE